MKKNITHITQLTREDLQKLEAAADPKPGFLIRIEKSNGEIKIEVDETAFKTAVFGFLHNLQAIFPVTPSQETICNTPCVPN